MTKLQTIFDQLGEPQRVQVENYAASLLHHRPAVNAQPNRIQLDKLEGLLVTPADDVPDEEINRRVRNAWADAAED